MHAKTKVRKTAAFRAMGIAVAGALCAPLFVSAHATLLAGLEGQVEGNRIAITITLPEERTLDDRALFETYTKENLLFANNGDPCAVFVTDFVTGNVREARPTTIILSVLCETPVEKLAATSTYFADEGFVFSSTFTKDGDARTFIFSDENREAVFSFGITPDTRREKSSLALLSVGQFIWQGVKHIGGGYDHILFVLALLLGVRGLLPLVKIVTAFTVAHSLTLILSAFDLVSVAPIIVEPLIALSIAYVAFEKYLLRFAQTIFKTVQTEALSHRWKIAFAFGLVHGLGFAGVLKEIHIPESVFVLSLLSFNVGVEIGQLVIIAFAFPLLYFTRTLKWQERALAFFSIGIGAAGIWWFFERVFL